MSENAPELLADAKNERVRIYPEDRQITIPVSPTDGTSHSIETRDVDSFVGTVAMAEIEDEEISFTGLVELDEDEWHRLGLAEQWEHDDTADSEQDRDDKRVIEITGARGPGAPWDIQLRVSVAVVPHDTI